MLFWLFRVDSPAEMCASASPLQAWPDAPWWWQSEPLPLPSAPPAVGRAAVGLKLRRLGWKGLTAGGAGGGGGRGGSLGHTLQCVVLTGMPMLEANTTVRAEASSIVNPLWRGWGGCGGGGEGGGRRRRLGRGGRQRDVIHCSVSKGWCVSIHTDHAEAAVMSSLSHSFAHASTHAHTHS